MQSSSLTTISRKSESFPIAPSLATPTSTLEIGSTPVYSFTFATLGYDEIALISPYDTTQYYFRLPENWTVQTDGILYLDLSYVYDRIIQSEDFPALFGELVILLR